jgi:hypothetical protein
MVEPDTVRKQLLREVVQISCEQTLSGAVAVVTRS